MSATAEAVLVLIVLAALSLLSAYVVYRVLQGTAVIRHRGIELGGAAAIFVLTFILLNRYLPDIRDGILGEALAAQPIQLIDEDGAVEVAKLHVAPSEQVVTSRDFRRLDRNRFHVNDSLEIAVVIPSGGAWRVDRFDKVPAIGLHDIPALAPGLSAYESLFGMTLSSVWAVHTVDARDVTLDSLSVIDGVRMSFNPFEYPEFIRASFDAQMEALAQLGLHVDDDVAPDAEEMEEFLAEFGIELASQFGRTLAAQLPVTKRISSGIYVVPVSREAVTQGPLSQQLFSELSLLDYALNALALSGATSIGSMQNLYVNQEKQLASFDGSVKLHGVEVDGRTTDLLVNQLGFLVAGPERALIVLVVYLSDAPIAVLRQLESALRSLRFTA